MVQPVLPKGTSGRRFRATVLVSFGMNQGLHDHESEAMALDRAFMMGRTPGDGATPTLMKPHHSRHTLTSSKHKPLQAFRLSHEL